MCYCTCQPECAHGADVCQGGAPLRPLLTLPVCAHYQSAQAQSLLVRQVARLPHGICSDTFERRVHAAAQVRKVYSLDGINSVELRVHMPSFYRAATADFTAVSRISAAQGGPALFQLVTAAYWYSAWWPITPPQ